MREYKDKTAAGGFGFSRRGSNLAFRDPNHDDRSIQCCNRLGCSTRYYSMKGTQIGNPEKAKYPKASFRSVSNKTIAGRSSQSLSASSDSRKRHQEQVNQRSIQETAHAESSSRQGDREDLESNNRQGETVLPEDGESAILHGFSENVTKMLENCGTNSRSRTLKQVNRPWESSNQDASSSPSICHSITSRNTIQTNKYASQVAGSGAQKYGLKNVSCTQISNVLPSGSSSDSGRNRRVDVVRKRRTDGETSSSRGKSIAPSIGGYSGSRHRDLSAPSLSIPEHLIPQQASTRARNRPTSRDGTVSVRSLRAPTGKTRFRLSEQEDDRSLSLSVPIMTSELPQTQPSTSEAVPESASRSFSIELPSISPNTFGRSGSSSRTAHIIPNSHSEDINTGIFHGPLGESEGHLHFNMERIVEVLLALERNEQNEEITYEQLLVLEANLSLEGLVFHDQHRDMRMDIDNMTYEELLALEEKMGTVSLALTEEALSRCLKRTIYTPASLVPEITDCEDDDTKCSICQEEYATGDELGKLACEHRYHVACIHQWLGQKNWCPICKASACSS